MTSKIAAASARAKEKIHEIKEKTETASFIKLKDKVSFVLGVANVALTAYIIGKAPDSMPLFFTIKAIVMLSLRLYLFRKRKMHYYLFDFCYFANVLVLIYIHLMPQSETLFLIIWAFSNGPLAWAILTWRNSLVLHSLSMTTSVFIHITPALLLYTLRWHADSPESLERFNTLRDTSPSFTAACLVPLLPYLVWQIFYYIKVEVFSSEKVEARSYETSFRYMRGSKGLMGVIIRKFNSRGQQLMAFITCQFIYTVLTILPAPLYLHYYWLHTTFLVLMLAISLWNGSNYYFEVFAAKYNSSLPPQQQLPHIIEEKKE